MRNVIEEEEVMEEVEPEEIEPDEDDEEDDEENDDDYEDDEDEDEEDDEDLDEDLEEDDMDKENNEELDKDMQPVRVTPASPNPRTTVAPTTAIAGHTPVPTPIPNRRGRKPDPIREIDRQAIASREARKLPPHPGNKLSFEEMTKYLSLLTPPMWEHVVIYVYRLWPVIDRKLAEPSAYAYINKFSKLFTEGEVIAQHGGGEYKFQVNDIDAGRTLFTCIHTISWNDVDPILNIRELDLASKKNKPYIDKMVALGKIQIADGRIHIMPTVGEVRAMQEGQTSQTVVKEVLDFMKSQAKPDEAYQHGLALVANAARTSQEMLAQQSNPTGMLGMMEKFLAVLTANKPPQDNTMALMMPMFMQMMQSQADTTRLMMQLMMEGNKQIAESIKAIAEAKVNPANESEGNDEFSKFDKILDMAAKIKYGPNVGMGSESPWYIDLARALAPVAAPVIGQLVNRGMQPQQPMPMGMQPNGIPNNGMPQLEQPPETEEQMRDRVIQQQLAKYGQEIIQAVALDNKGYEFAESVESFAGPIVYKQISNLGPDKLIILIKGIPPLWQHLMSITSEDKFKVWVTEFTELDKYRDILDGEDDSEETVVSNETSKVEEIFNVTPVPTQPVTISKANGSASTKTRGRGKAS